MSDKTSIQWADSTINPIMGCGGCELFPKPATVLANIAKAINDAGASPEVTKSDIKNLFQDLVTVCIKDLESKGQRQPEHSDLVTTTNISQLRKRFIHQIEKVHGKNIAHAADTSIRKSITCYAYVLHNMRGISILNGNRKGNSGHAPVFEKLTYFERRMADAANWHDMLGETRLEANWKHQIARLIFISDMGDALTDPNDFDFLEKEVMPAIRSKNGRRHIWLWLTKRPHLMMKFAEKVGGFPENLCAMTTLTGPDSASMKRLIDLKNVDARMRGLSIEPLWERIPPSTLDLTGIDWVIVGGESGSGLKFTRPFALEWAEELRDHCHKHHVAFFMKQLGRNPSRGGGVFRLKDDNGGNWDEWPDAALKVREFPAAFHAYRREELKVSDKLRPFVIKKKKGDDQSGEGGEVIVQAEMKAVTVSSKVEKAEFERLHNIISKGVKAFVEAGEALKQMHDGKLWKAGGFDTWEDYCRSVAGMSRAHAHRLMQASECVNRLKETKEFSVFPISESQVRPLLRLPDPNLRIAAWLRVFEVMGENRKQPTASEVKQAVTYVMHYDDEDDTVKMPPTRTEQRSELVSKLREAVTERHSWEDVEKLLADLEKLI